MYALRIAVCCAAVGWMAADARAQLGTYGASRPYLVEPGHVAGRKHAVGRDPHDLHFHGRRLGVDTGRTLARRLRPGSDAFPARPGR